MSDTENKKVKNFFYKHNNGMLFDNRNGMMNFSLDYGVQGIAVYSLTLEHLAENENTVSMENIEKHLFSLRVFREIDVKAIVMDCPDLESDGENIYSKYLNENLKTDLEFKEKSTKDGFFGHLVRYLDEWESSKDYNKISKNLNSCLTDSITNPNAIQWIIENPKSLKELDRMNSFENS